ncbi:helix-turn-helix domain-containing protein [uncultured Bacteroides sp.]
MQIFLFDLWNIYANEINRQEQLSNISANLFSCFLDLVRQRVTENREVGFYANLLCVTPKYLSEVVRKGSGKSVSYWINGYAMQEIVTMLKNSDITLSEISDRMNFYSQSHFSRFVKKMLGVSPSEYRSELDKKRNKI